mmetsp:Transcript_28116/g.42886  ORF Transcript_28116/g.42886 Transcript_28116/m.42886 type:complete len:544 (+) Transcript_28116:102-1733(+)
MNKSQQTETESQHVLPYTDGLRVIDSGGRLGKVAIASIDFSPLDVVLLEPPAIVFDDKNGYFSLFDEFLASSSEVKQSVLAMHHEDISSTETSTTLSIHEDVEQRMRDMLVESELKRYAMQKPSEASNLNDDLCKNLVRIVGINAHSFTPPNAPQHEAIANASTSSGSNMLDTAMALFVIGSKVEHSCAPNLRFCTDKGLLRYTAEVPISCEDRLSISYLKSTLHTPRDERQQFLQQNKKFDCRCTRCLGPDECSPLYCQKCNGTLFNTYNVSKDEEEWCCSSTSCAWKISGTEGALDSIQTQLSTLDEIHEDIDFFRGTLQYGIEESTLPAVMDTQAKVVEHAHPLHWLHIAAWDLVSIVASSNARILMKEGFSPTSSEVTRLLRLSATCQIHQIFWTERNAAIVHGRLKLKDAVDIISTCPYGSHSLQVNFMEDVGEFSSLIDLLCEEPGRRVGSVSESTWNDCTEVSQTVFHAGQDILLAGYPKLTSKLYTRYQSMFLVSSAPWVVGNKNKECFRALVESGGNTNNFSNHLLACYTDRHK